MPCDDVWPAHARLGAELRVGPIARRSSNDVCACLRDCSLHTGTLKFAEGENLEEAALELLNASGERLRRIESQVNLPLSLAT